MMTRRGWWLVWAFGCGGKEIPPQPEIENDPPVPIDIQTTASTPEARPPFDCFADITIDEGRDGVIDGTGFAGYDAANPTWRMYAENDNNGNGLIDSYELYERDAAGNTTRYERLRSGPYTTVSTFDARGNILTYDYDSSSDGLLDTSYHYTWDTNDTLLRYEVDEDGDGFPDYIADYESTPEGFRTSMREDDDGDGELDTLFLYTYDDVDRVSIITVDAGGDDVVEGAYTYTYTDPTLRIGSSSYDADSDGIVDVLSEFEYNEDGLALYTATDTSPDGVWDEERSTTRDSEGRILTESVINTTSSDVYSYSFTYVYDSLGRTIQDTFFFAYEGEAPLDDEQTNTTFGGTCP